MPALSEVAFLYAPGGMNGSEDSPSRVADTEYARGTNVELLNELPTTRHGVVIRDFSGSVDSETAANLARAINGMPETAALVSAMAVRNVVTLTAVAEGVAGNDVVISSSNQNVAVSGVTLSGGKAAHNATGSFTLNAVSGMVRVRIAQIQVSVPAAGVPSAQHAATENIQGARFFNPAKGQGGIVFSANYASVLIAIGGRKYSAHFEGRGMSARFALDDISNGLLHDPALHSVWWSAWEDIALMQDGQGRAFIWQYPKPARSSEGYKSDTVHKSGSEVPNGATVMAYAHARGIAVVNRRAILVSDNLHKSNLTDSSDLLRFTEQVYNVTSLYFLPPSDMGNITAAEILPLRNTVHGHGDVMFHCEDGIFSIDLNQHPRSKWPEMSLVKHAALKTGATGAYALVLFDGDQLFRTRAGVQSLRSAAANDDPEDNSQGSLSDRVTPFLRGDYPRWLRFSSLASWTTARRLFCSCYPVVQGRFRSHRGMIARNFRPSLNQPMPPCWEGLWTLPREAAGIVQFVNGIFDGEERMLALCRSADGVNRLVEFTDWLTYDILPDGTKRRISCQVITRGITGQAALNQKEFRAGTIFWKNIRTDLDWGIWYRNEKSAAWTFWQAGKVTMPAPPDSLDDPNPAATAITLGDLPRACGGSAARWVQFLVRWKGYATFESLRIKAGQKDADEDKFDAKLFNQTYQEVRPTDYSDFEYSEGSDWIDNLAATAKP